VGLQITDSLGTQSITFKTREFRIDYINSFYEPLFTVL
jgi:hypothetical protein